MKMKYLNIIHLVNIIMMNNQLQSGTVTSAWGRGGSAWDDDED